MLLTPNTQKKYSIQQDNVDTNANVANISELVTSKLHGIQRNMISEYPKIIS